MSVLDALLLTLIAFAVVGAFYWTGRGAVALFDHLEVRDRRLAIAWKWFAWFLVASFFVWCFGTVIADVRGLDL